MRHHSIIIVIFIVCSLLSITCVPCHAAQTPWACTDDDVANNIYRICNYFPLAPNDHWQYTTGDRFILDNIHTCASSCSGILYGSTTYEYSSYVQNGQQGLLFAGCQYQNGVFEDMGKALVFIPPQIKVGATVRKIYKFKPTVTTICDTTLVGLETITVPAGTFDTLRIELMIQDIGKCSYTNTIWVAKGIGIIRSLRTDANPPDCLGCIFTCVPDNDVVKLNTPAELISFDISNSSQGADLTGTWTSLAPSCKNTTKGIKCTVTGKLAIRNIGNQDASSSKTRIYISNDNTYDGSDALLKRVATGIIKPYKQVNYTFSYSFPYGVSLSGKYIIAVIDADNTVTEADETNNIIVFGPLP